MAEPSCEKCGGHDFESSFVGSAKVILAYCQACGHIAGVLPDYQVLANAIVLNLTRGCKNNTGHPVLHVKQEGTVFG